MEKPRIDVINFIAPVTSQTVNQFFQITDMIIQGLDPFIMRQPEPTKKQSTQVIIRISSTGGSIQDAFAATEQIHALKQIIPSVITHNVSHIASAANLIYLAADIRRTSPNSSFLFHALTNKIFHDTSCNYQEFNSHYYSLKKNTEEYIKYFVDRTNHANNKLDISSALNGAGDAIISSAHAQEFGITTEGVVHAFVPEWATFWSVAG